MQHPAIDAAMRGTFDGMRHARVLDYLKALGITSLELMPVHAFIDERHLASRGLRNFWGYNSIAFFAPAPRYGRTDPVREFRDMVRALHDAGIEVILDVVYNHTGESDAEGPTLGFRGLDNLAYYRTMTGEPGTYVNDTGTGNTINADHPEVRRLVTESLCYWHKEMGVDGFRFDLAPVLGRHDDGFSTEHPLLRQISDEPRLRNAKLVAEPWDAGPGGYQLGRFPPRWAEWNDVYRDTLRRFWRGDHDTGRQLAACLRGSAEVFERSGRGPAASVNLVTSHDGFTLADVVSYRERHNQPNGEDNRDGHAHNYSDNYGVEGPAYDPEIRAIRHRQRLNLLATLLLSQGTPLLLAGDEFGNSQYGNNNAYAQDNPTGWLDWAGLDRDPGFLAQVRKLIALRRETPILRLPDYIHGRVETDEGRITVTWLRPDGLEMQPDDWQDARAFVVLLAEAAGADIVSAAALLLNVGPGQSDFSLPAIGTWRLAFASSTETMLTGRTLRLPAPSIACGLLEPARGAA
jgi:glycogen operon protein